MFAHAPLHRLVLLPGKWFLSPRECDRRLIRKRVSAARTVDCQCHARGRRRTAGGSEKAPDPRAQAWGSSFRRGRGATNRAVVTNRGVGQCSCGEEAPSGEESATTCVKRTNVPLSWRSRQPSQSQNRVCRVLRRSRLDRLGRHPMKLGQCGAGVADPEGTEREQVKHNSGRSSREDTDACRPRCLAIEWNQAPAFSLRRAAG